MTTGYHTGAAAAAERKVLVLVNPRSGLRWSFDTVRHALDRFWDRPGTELSYQFCQSKQDGIDKVRRAVDRGVNSVLVMGGDGTVNSVGCALIGTPVCLGIIPVGSGNGFARHFEIPLVPEKAIESLAHAAPRDIDVGIVSGIPFFVTCSMAWDASVAKSFARSPIRGIAPYIFAGVQELFEYEAQDICVSLDGGEEIRFHAPMVFTVANLSQYGGGARIAPHAKEDDGHLELVVTLRQDIPKLIANIGRLFDGSLHTLPEIYSSAFRTMKVRRERAAPIQVDGELMEAGQEVEVSVLPETLRVLVPLEKGQAG